MITEWIYKRKKLAVEKFILCRSVVVALLASPDTPTLLETVRLLRICLSDDESCTAWLSSIVEDLDNFASSSQFILSSSTNGEQSNHCFAFNKSILYAETFA